jgi:hypothetical protein
MKEIILALTISLGLGACGGSQQPAQQSAQQSAQESAQQSSSQQSSKQDGGACIKTGCSGTVCTEPGKEVITNCLYKPEYGCYKTARCERQADGACGWTQTAELTACLSNPPPM